MIENAIKLYISTYLSGHTSSSCDDDIENMFHDYIDYYINKTNRRVTLEYIMLRDINDNEESAYELAKLFKGKLVYINIIPYNETSNFDFKRSNDFKIKKFYDILKSNNINVTIRKEMGNDLSAACGQLRANENNEVNK